MRKNSFLGTIASALIVTLTLAGCNSADPAPYTSKRIERAKLLNEIRADKETAKANNELINKAADSATVNSVNADMKKLCNASDIGKLVKNETCYVKKLEAIKSKDIAPGKEQPALRTECYGKEFKVGPECQKAINPLEHKIDVHVTPRS